MKRSSIPKDANVVWDLIVRGRYMPEEWLRAWSIFQETPKLSRTPELWLRARRQAFEESLVAVDEL